MAPVLIHPHQAHFRMASTVDFARRARTASMGHKVATTRGRQCALRPEASFRKVPQQLA